MLQIVRGFCAAALMMISLAWVPLQSFAQVPCVPGLTCPRDTTPPTVRITSPAPGDTVSGTITVTAEASDNVGVAGVRFKYDGVNFDTEDTSAPYSATAYTNNVPDGSYTLTAVARDAAGNQTTSAPVSITVANAPPPPAGVTRYEETDPSVTFSAVGWKRIGDDWIGWSGGSAVDSITPGAQAKFTFTGTSVSWIGYRGNQGGIARVSLDGVLIGDVDLFARSVEIRVPVFTATGLADANHTLTIEVTGLKNPEADLNAVPVDAFDVPAPVVSRLQNTDPDATYTTGWAPATDTRMSWSGGDAVVSGTAGAQATLTFNGTSISWNGLNSPDTGIARVYLDGAFAAEVDTYSPTHKIQNAVFTSGPLADASHTLTIEATGLKNAASTSAQILVDSFDVTTPGIRVEETDPSVTYAGTWAPGNRNRPWSMGTSTVSATAGSQATLSFTGTSVSWIGFRAPRTGIARVTLDGAFVAEVDTYGTSEGFQNPLFTISGLAHTAHTLTIEVTGRKNPASTDNYVVVDAFNVRP